MDFHFPVRVVRFLERTARAPLAEEASVYQDAICKNVCLDDADPPASEKKPPLTRQPRNQPPRRVRTDL